LIVPFTSGQYDQGNGLCRHAHSTYIYNLAKTLQLPTQWYSAGVSNTWPMGHMRHAKLVCEALMQILFRCQNVTTQYRWSNVFEFTGLKVVCCGVETPAWQRHFKVNSYNMF
jgi:hypothetical protein